MKNDMRRTFGRGPAKLFALLLAALMAVSLAVPAFAGNENNSASVRIDFTAEAGTTVTITGKSCLPEVTQITTDSAEAGSFILTYNEPGNYGYRVSNGKEDYTAIVTAYYENEVLVATLMITRKGRSGKFDRIDFTRTPTPTFTPTPVPPTATPGVSKPPQTGDASSAGLYAALLAAALGICGAVLVSRRTRRGE